MLGCDAFLRDPVNSHVANVARLQHPQGADGPQRNVLHLNNAGLSGHCLAKVVPAGVPALGRLEPGPLTRIRSSQDLHQHPRHLVLLILLLNIAHERPLDLAGVVDGFRLNDFAFQSPIAEELRIVVKVNPRSRRRHGA